MTTEQLSDVHAHAHGSDLAEEPAKGTDFEAESAGRPARARVIPAFWRGRQGSDRKKIDVAPEAPSEQNQAPEESSWDIGSVHADELEAAAKAAEKSAMATVPMTPVRAAKQIFPGKGEAGSKGQAGRFVVWSAMTAAGLIRALMVTVGWTISSAFETRIRAGVAGSLLTLIVLVAWLAQLA